MSLLCPVFNTRLILAQYLHDSSVYLILTVTYACSYSVIAVSHAFWCVQELVSEKLSVQQQSVELERLNEELEKIGLNREKLLQQEHTLEDR